MPPDRGLMFRTAAAMVLLVALYATVVTFFAVLNPGTLMPGAILLAVAFAVVHLAAPAVLLRDLRAKELSDRTVAPGLRAVVERLCALADIREPRLMIANVRAPNAFVVGRALCVTRGLLTARLTTPELEAIVAHELSHLRHRDSVIIDTAAVLGGFFLLPQTEDGQRASLGDKFKGAVGLLAFWPLILLLGWIPLLSWLVTLTLSRTREFAADRSGAILTGNPSALASALVKLSTEIAQTPTRDLRQIQRYTALLCVDPPGRRSIIAHPPLRRRLDRLTKISATLGTL